MKFPPRAKHGTPPPVVSSTQPRKVRFASDNFNYNLTLDKSAPYWHEPVANLGVTLGSGPMMFFVGTMGNAADGMTPLAVAAAQMSPERPPTNWSS